MLEGNDKTEGEVLTDSTITSNVGGKGPILLLSNLLSHSSRNASGLPVR